MKDWFQSIGDWFEDIGELLLDALDSVGQWLLDTLIVVCNAVVGYCIDCLIWLWQNFIYPLFLGITEEWDAPFGELFSAIDVDGMLAVKLVAQLANWGLLATLAISCVGFLATVHLVKHLLKLAPVVD